MKTRIGLDVDGVLRGFTEKVVELSNQAGLKMEMPTTYYFLGQEIDGDSIRSKIWKSKEWLEEVFLESKVLEKSKSGYHMFCDDPQFEVYIVSAQIRGTEHLTDKWLLKNGFDRHVKNIYTHKKLNAPCQILIDDKPTNITDYNDNARMGVLIDRTYNQDFLTPYRVTNLIEAYNLLK